MRKNWNLLPGNSLRRAACALGCGVALALLAAPAQAAIVAFENPAGPGHFEWFGGTSTASINLDMTVPAASQTGLSGYARFGQKNDLPSNNNVHGGVSGEILGGGFGNAMLIGLSAGIEISGSSTGVWDDSRYLFHPSASPNTELTVGEFIYVGVRFPSQSGGNWHYGWIGAEVFTLPDTFGSDGDAIGLDAFSWGYESTPDTPIAAGATGVPAPGAFVTLGIAALGLAGRGRRRK